MKRFLGLLLYTALAVLPAASAQSTFSLAPVVLSTDSDRSLITSVTFTNTSTRTVKVEASVMAWSQVDGRHTETPTRDLLLNPSTFTVGPGESQLIRVGLRRKPTSGELTYRLHLDQRSLTTPQTEVLTGQVSAERGNPGQPSSAPELRTQIEQLFAVTLPVYFAPGAASPKLGFSLAIQGADLLLRIQNTGNRHETLYGLTLTRAGQLLDFPPNAVLAGGTVQYTLKNWGTLNGPVSLQYRSAVGETVRAAPPLP